MMRSMDAIDRRASLLVIFALFLLFSLPACAPAPQPLVVPNASPAQPDQPVTMPDQDAVVANLSPSPNAIPSQTALGLVEGRTSTVRVLGNLYTVRLAAATDAGVTLTVNSQDFSLRTGEEFSFGDFLIRLDSVALDAVREPRPSSADVTLRIPASGSVRDILQEGTAKRYRFSDGASYTVALVSVGTDGKGGTAALFSVDGDERTLTPYEDGSFNNGAEYLFVHYLYPSKAGAMTALAAANITIIQNT